MNNDLAIFRRTLGVCSFRLAICACAIIIAASVWSRNRQPVGGSERPPAVAKPNVPPSGIAYLTRFSSAGRRIADLCREGKKEAAARLLRDLDDASPGKAESEVLEASVAVLDALSPSGQVRYLMIQSLPRGIPGGVGLTDDIRRHLTLAADVDPKWKSFLGDLLLDLVTCQLQMNAEHGDSAHLFGDTVLFSPKSAYYSGDGQADDLNGLVIGSIQSPASATAAGSTSLMAAGILREHREQYEHFLLGSSWCEVLKLANDLAPGSVERWRGTFRELEQSFANRGLYTSALLVLKHGRAGGSIQSAPEFMSGVAALKEYSASAKSPDRIRCLAIALGYWGEAHRSELKGAKERELPDLKGLVILIGTQGGWCDAILVAHHLELSDLDMPPCLRNYPWRANSESQRLFEAAMTQKDPDRYEEQMRHPAEMGHAEAMFALADFYERRRLTKSDAELSGSWYEKADAAGLAEAANRLGLWCENGCNVQKDAQRAADYYTRAGNAGLPVALCNAARLYREHWRTTGATNLAVELYRHAAAAGSALAMNELACHHLTGTGVEKSELKAFNLLGESARLGYAPALYNLGLCYMEGRGTVKNPNKAFEVTLAAATNGWPPAMYQAAVFYHNGTGTATDLQLADFWMAKAYKAGDADAKKEYQRRARLNAQRRLVEDLAREPVQRVNDFNPLLWRQLDQSGQQLPSQAQERYLRSMRDYRYQHPQ